jgi:spore maturation protein CgeB
VKMRVLLIGEVRPDSFADNVSTTLVEAGHVVRTVAPFSGPTGGQGRLWVRLRAELPWVLRVATWMQAHVVDAAEELRPDLVLNLDYRLAWPVVRRVREASGAAVAFWLPDSVGSVARETHVLADYDAVFLKDTTVVDRYRAMLGLNAHFLPEACNPRWHRPPPGISPGDDGPRVLVAGNMYATRFKLVQRLLAAGIEVEVHGPSPPGWLVEGRLPTAFRPRSYLARETKARAFRGALAVLNSLASHEADGLNCRLFEAAGCGAVVLTEFREQLPIFFDPESEVLGFASFDELVDRVRAVAALTAAERCALGDAAARRAHADHGYAQRFDRIVSALGRG